MRHGSRPRQVGLAAALGLSATLVTGASPAGTDVAVTVTGMRSAEGLVQACMSRDPDHFLDCSKDPRAFTRTVPAARLVNLEFDGIPPGRYAIALAHDENGNGKMDRAMGLMPKEGFGFSRDAKVRFGPPSFEDAAIEIGDKPAHYTIRMRYMF